MAANVDNTSAKEKASHFARQAKANEKAKLKASKGKGKFANYHVYDVWN